MYKLTHVNHGWLWLAWSTIVTMGIKVIHSQHRCHDEPYSPWDMQEVEEFIPICYFEHIHLYSRLNM